MYIPVGIIGHGNIIHIPVPVQVQVVDPAVFTVEVPFKLFQGFRFLEELHDGVEVEVVAGQSEVFGLPLLCCGGNNRRRENDQECCGDYIFHCSRFW